MDTDTTTNPILVTGATGKTGRRVAERLRALGHPIRPGSRSAAVPFAWDDPATWDPALEGVTAAYVVYVPDLGYPGAAEVVGAFAHRAAAHGVERLVLLSGRGEEDAALAEDAVRAAVPATTVVRASWFAQNFSEHFLLGPVLDGLIALPAGDVAEPFVDLDDVADVAVAALTQPGHAGRLYELTGPELLTFADVAAALTRATGRPIGYQPVTPEAFAADAVAHGVPAEEVGPLTEIFTRVFDGRNAFVTADVERVLGRPATPFAAYAAAAAATGAWAALAAVR